MILDLQLDEDITSWLTEDIPYWDVSFNNDDDLIKQGKIIAKESGIVAGLAVAKRILHLMDIECSTNLQDGAMISKGETLLELSGLASKILQSERVMLNILSHMSGIASITNQFVQRIEDEGLTTRIAATRKTLPGLRKYQKWAVIIGGGDTHRLDLSAMALIKENHIASFGGVIEAISAVRDKISFSHKVEIEVTNNDELMEAIKAKVDIVMLDNYTVKEIEEILPEVRKLNDHVLIEASGNINSETFLDYAKAGVDIISMGMLTHSVTAFDYSLILDN